MDNYGHILNKGTDVVVKVTGQKAHVHTRSRLANGDLMYGIRYKNPDINQQAERRKFPLYSVDAYVSPEQITPIIREGKTFDE